MVLHPLRVALVVGLLLAACGTEEGAPTLGSTAGTDAAATGDGAGLGDGASAADGAGSTDATAADGTIAGDGAPSGGDGALTDTPGADAAPGQDTGAPPADVTYPDVPSKYETCNNLLTCVTFACAQSKDKACAAVCTDAASPAAKAAIAPTLACVDQYCFEGLCKGSSDPNCIGQCVYEKCLSKMMACAADGKSGTATCDTAFGCIDGCKEKGLSCMGDCWAAMAKPAQADFDAIAACANAAGGKDPFAACPEQVFKCISAGKVGSKSCMDLLACNDGCKGLPEGKEFMCNGACYGQASAAAQQAWLGVATCDKGGSDKACVQGIVACADPVGTKTCLDTIGCNDKCKKSGKSDGACLLGCLHEASKVEAQKTVDLFLCLDKTCKPACKGDKACEDGCAQGTCKAQYDGCLGK